MKDIYLNTALLAGSDSFLIKKHWPKKAIFVDILPIFFFQNYCIATEVIKIN